MKKIERTAIHEAGHAVANFDLGLAIKRISIIPNEKDDALGYVVGSKWGKDFDPEIYTDAKTRGRIEKEYMSLISGFMAERLLTGRAYRSQNSSDYRNAVKLLFTQVGSDKEFNAYAKWLDIRTEQMLKMPFYIYAIKKLSEKLIEKRCLNGREAREIIRNAIIEYGHKKDINKSAIS